MPFLCVRSLLGYSEKFLSDFSCFPNKFSKTTITVRLNLLHVYPPVPHFVFVALFIPYFHVLSSHFYISLTFLAVTTG